MSPERWRQVESLYDSALERDPESRASYLSEACNGDDELRRLVESLIEKGDTPDSPLEKPVDAPLRFGPYSIVEKLGAGGMGEVYKAYDQRLNRTVAIKVLKSAFSDRFQREARAIAALNHPHICTLHDIGDGYLVMEYVEGAPLKGPLGVNQALEYTAQICDALDAAHRAGIVHRDLKPANILVTKRGIKLLDFGIARMMEGGDTLTEEGAVLGTPAYMAPEVLGGQAADARSDIYSLGCVLQEIVTGSRAVAKRLEPPELDRVVRTCREEDPEKRWQTARELKLALELVREPAVPARKRLWLVGAGVSAALLILAAWIAFRKAAPGTGAPRYQFTVNAPTGTRFNAVSISPDGSLLAFVAKGQLWLRRLDGLESHPLPETNGARGLFWAPESRRIAFYTLNRLKTIDLATGKVNNIVASDGTGSWSRDDVVLFVRDRVLHRVPASGGPAVRVTRLREGERAHGAAWFLPDGRHFLYSVAYSGTADIAAHVGSLDAPDERHRLMSVDGGRIHYSSLPGRQDGHILFVRAGDLMAQPFDPGQRRLLGEAVRVVPNVAFFSASSTAAIASRPPPGSPLEQLVWRDRQGKNLGVAGEAGRLGPISLSSDGERVVQTIEDPATGETDVWVRDLRRKTLVRLPTRGPDFNPVWSPDGEQIVFGLGGLYGRSPMYRRRSVGAEPEPLGVVGRPTDWSGNGEFLMVWDTFDLAVVRLTDRPEAAAYAQGLWGEFEGRFSPETSGPPKWVAYTLAEPRAAGVYVQAFTPGKRASGVRWKVSSLVVAGVERAIEWDGDPGPWGDQPRWRADGKELYYRWGKRIMAVPVEADGPQFHSGAPVQLFEGNPGTDYAVTRDGSRFLMLEVILDQPFVETPVTITLNWQATLK